MKNIMHVVAGLGMLAMLLSGCQSKQPQPDVDLRLDRSGVFRAQMNQEVLAEPVQGSLTLPMAIARAIKYNLDHRVKMMETAVAQEQLKMARLSYLPQVTAMVGYAARNNEAGALHRSLVSGDLILEHSTSQEKDHTLSTLRASWEVIDFGLTYFTVVQKSNEIAIASEQRRKVVQNIIQDIQEAYWRAYITQELLAEVDAIAAESEQALVHFKGLVNTGRVDPKEGLTQQRELLQIRLNMRNLQEQLAQGRILLNMLLNLPPDSHYRLEAVVREDLPVIGAHASKLEGMALMNRPELRMEDSMLKISQVEIKKSAPRHLVWI